MTIEDKKNKEKQEVREKILNVSMKLFNKKGIDNISIRKIAKKINYSPATIYLYFPDKDEILTELRMRGFEELFNNMSMVEKENPIERLKSLGKEYLKYALENQDFYNLMMSVDKPKDFSKGIDSIDSNDKCYLLIKNTILEIRKKNLMEIHNVDASAMSFWAILHGIASLVIYKKESLEQVNIDINVMYKLMYSFINDNLFCSSNIN